MRMFAALAAVAVLAVAALLTVDADAARKPTPAERAAVTYAVLTQVPEIPGSPAVVVLRRIVVSTVQPGHGSSFSRFAAASGFARDASGYPAGSRTALVGFHRRVQGWIMLDYRSSRAGCRKPQGYFGGRRAAILRDLGIRCR